MHIHASRPGVAFIRADMECLLTGATGLHHAYSPALQRYKMNAEDAHDWRAVVIRQGNRRAPGLAFVL